MNDGERMLKLWQKQGSDHNSRLVLEMHKGLTVWRMSFDGNRKNNFLSQAGYNKDISQENMKKFDSFWNDLLIDLRTPKKIKNWTAKKGPFGEDFTAQATTDNVVLCTTLKGSENTATRKDFELIYNDWEGYVSERIPRVEFAESFVTKYTISIIHQFLK